MIYLPKTCTIITITQNPQYLIIGYLNPKPYIPQYIPIYPYIPLYIPFKGNLIIGYMDPLGPSLNPKPTKPCSYHVSLKASLDIRVFRPPLWECPNIRGTVLGVPMIRTIAFGVYIGSPYFEKPPYNFNHTWIMP